MNRVTRVINLTEDEKIVLTRAKEICSEVAKELEDENVEKFFNIEYFQELFNELDSIIF